MDWLLVVDRSGANSVIGCKLVKRDCLVVTHPDRRGCGGTAHRVKKLKHSLFPNLVRSRLTPWNITLILKPLELEAIAAQDEGSNCALHF